MLRKNRSLFDNIKKSISKDDTEDRYYKKVASKYKFAKYVTIFVLGLFIIVALVWGSRYITRDNIMYLFRDFASTPVYDLNNLKTISYNNQQNEMFGKINNKLYIVGNGKAYIYAANGKESLQTDLNYANANMDVSSKYMLIYDAGTTNYSIYNSVARVANKKTGYNIVNGKISEKGAYAFVTRSEDTKFKVELYSTSFNLAATYYKDSYVSDIAINDDGSKILISSYMLNDYDYHSTIQLFSSKEVNPISQFEFHNKFPYKTEKTDFGWVVFFDNSLVIINENGEIVKELNYPSTDIISANISGDYISTCFKSGAQGENTRLVVVNKNGETVYDETLRCRTIYMAFDASKIYLLSYGKYMEVSTEGNISEHSCSYDIKSIVVFDEFIYLCSSSKALPVVLK